MNAPHVSDASASIAALKSLVGSGLNAVTAFDADIVTRQFGSTNRGGELGGLTVAIKDNICTRDYATTCASRVLEGYRSPYDATVVTRLRESGAVIACKTNMDEFGMGSSTEHSWFGPALNPAARDRVPGGSSGGSAVAVATESVDAALGSDTGGSVRQPAAFCGVVGYKPTYGRISRYGLVAFGSSLEQIGVFGRNVEMVARVAKVISGEDPADSTSHGAAVHLEHAADPSAVTLGLPAEYLSGELGEGVREVYGRAVDRLRAAGISVCDVSLPHTDLALPAYYVIASAEASANLARFDGVRYGRREERDSVQAMLRETRGEGLGVEVKRRILVGSYVLSAGYYDEYYARALRARAWVAADFEKAFATPVDALFTPTTPTPAFRLGERLQDPVAMYRQDRFVCPTNLAGVPALSLPIGDVDGLPVGGQLIGKRDADGRLLGVAQLVESILSAVPA